jgi:hypothetical protein
MNLKCQKLLGQSSPIKAITNGNGVTVGAIINGTRIADNMPTDQNGNGNGNGQKHDNNGNGNKHDNGNGNGNKHDTGTQGPNDSSSAPRVSTKGATAAGIAS